MDRVEPCEMNELNDSSDQTPELHNTSDASDVGDLIADSLIANDVTRTAAPLIIEIVGTARHRSDFVVVDKYPFTVGRAYDNDLILSDGTVSPQHLILDRVGECVYVENLSQENGTQLEGKYLTAAKQPCELPNELILGRTHLRVLNTDSPVTATKPIVHLSKVTELCSNLRVALVLLLSYLLGSIYVAFESQSLWMNSNEVIVGQLLELVLPLALATLTSFISHLLTHRWRFSLQLSIASLIFLVQLFLNEVIAFVSYLYTDSGVAQHLNTILSIVLFTGLLAWQLRSISHLAQRPSVWISVGIVGSLFTVFILQDQVGQPDFLSQPDMHTDLRPSDIRFADSMDDVAEFRKVVEAELQLAISRQDSDLP